MIKLMLIIFLSIIVSGCVPRSMTKRQFDQAFITKSKRYTQQEVDILIKTNQCKFVADGLVTNIGWTLNSDVTGASEKLDKKLVEIGANAFSVVESAWILDSFGGTTLNVDYRAYSCNLSTQ